MIEIQVPEVAPSLNRLVRMHWAARNRLLKKWQWIVWAEVYRLGGPSGMKFHGKVRVRITRRSHHLLDADNLHGAAKLVLDALKTAKVIEDDSPEHIELHCEQESGSAQTTIRIDALTGEGGSPREPPVSPC